MSGKLFPRSLLLLLCGLAAAFVPGLAYAQDFAASQVRWRTDYNFARREAVDKKLPIFIDFYMIPCSLLRSNGHQFLPGPQGGQASQ